MGTSDSPDRPTSNSSSGRSSRFRAAVFHFVAVIPALGLFQVSARRPFELGQAQPQEAVTVFNLDVVFVYRAGQVHLAAKLAEMDFHLVVGAALRPRIHPRATDAQAALV